MTSPISFPDWMPWWAQLLILIIAILIGLAFALMPFSVFGVKSRLEVLEARLDEIQGEIRMLALRLPEPGRRGSYEEEPIVQAPAARPAAAARPPIPPASWAPESGPRRPIGTPPAADQRAEPGCYRPAPPAGRMEPRIDKGR
jgi:hypothetical protein